MIHISPTYAGVPGFPPPGGVEEGGGRRGTAVPSHVPRPNHAGRKNIFFFSGASNSPLVLFWSRETDNMYLCTGFSQNVLAVQKLIHSGYIYY